MIRALVAGEQDLERLAHTPTRRFEALGYTIALQPLQEAA
jgi:hypothetical protein